MSDGEQDALDALEREASDFVKVSPGFELRSVVVLSNSNRMLKLTGYEKPLF